MAFVLFYKKILTAVTCGFTIFFTLYGSCLIFMFTSKDQEFL